MNTTPSKQSQRALNALIFFISDIRHGIGPLISLHLRNTLLWDPAKIGIALAAVEFSAFINQIPAGFLIDSTKKKRLLIALACLLIIFGSLTIAFNSSLFPIVAAQLLLGIPIALIAPTIGSITLGLFGRERFPSRVGKNEVCNHTGNVVTALTAGIVAYLFGSFWIFFLLIGFAIASLVSLSLIKGVEINYQMARELPELGQEPIPVFELMKSKALIVFNICLIIYYMANGAQMSLVAQRLAIMDPENGALYITACMIIAEVVMICVAFVMSRIVSRFNRKTLFLAAFMILPIRALLFTLVDSPFLLLLIQTLDGVAAGILGVMGIIINSDIAVNTGRFNLVQSFGAMSTAIGESASLIAGGLIAYYYSFSISFVCLAIVACIGIGFFIIFMPETKSKQHEGKGKAYPSFFNNRL